MPNKPTSTSKGSVSKEERSVGVWGLGPKGFRGDPRGQMAHVQMQGVQVLEHKLQSLI